MEINIDYKKMSYISQLYEIFKFIDDIDENKLNVYLDFDNIAKLIKIAPILYKNVPSFRTQMITNSKSYSFKNDINDLFEFIINKSTNPKIANLFIICNKYTYDYPKNNKVTVINHDKFYSTINTNKQFSLIIDINNKKINNISDKENIHVLEIGRAHV